MAFSERQLLGFKKIAAKLKGRTRTLEHSQAISKAKTGKGLRPATKDKMSAKLHERYASGWAHPMKRHALTEDEVRQALKTHNSQLRAAEALGVSQMTLSRAKRKFGIDHDGKRTNKQTRGKGAYYKGRWMRSSWEIGFAKAMDSAGVKWQYEERTFKLGKRRYTPDFFLLEFGWFVEVKGHWYPSAKAKFSEFKKTYPEVNTLVLEDKIWQLPLTEFTNILLTRIGCHRSMSWSSGKN